MPPAGMPSQFAPSVRRPVSSGPSPGTYIKHVVVIVQENRSFENLFAGFPGADAPLYGRWINGKKIKLGSVHLAELENVTHDFGPAITSWNHGKMDGFNGKLSGLPPAYPYSHVVRSDVATYWNMARKYVLADHMFPTEFGPSFTGHLSLIAGTTSLSPTKAVANNPIGGPWACDAAPGTITFTIDPKRVISQGGAPCYSQFKTMADILDPASVSWKYYAPSYFNGPYYDKGGVLWSSFGTIKAVRYSPDWKNNVIAPQTRVLDDAKAGTLPGVSWVIPDWDWSDHPSTGSDIGPSWVASVVNAIGQGPDWNSTAIVIVWDDWGGWYDNVAPPRLDYRGPGIRVGCIIISPYAKPGYVAHTEYEFGSILRFAEEVFGLPTIGSASDGYTDARANSLDDAFDFTQAPRAFTPFAAKYSAAQIRRMRPSNRPPDTDL
jgi:phospholipase C